MMHFFEDLPSGYCSEVGRWQLTPEEVINFAKQWDPLPFHVDKLAAEASVFGGLVASSAHIFAICTRLFFDHEDQIQTMAMLGKDKIRFSQPARATDLLIYTTTCTQHKLSASRPDRGIITLQDRVTREAGDIVMTQEVTLMVKTRIGVSNKVT